MEGQPGSDPAQQLQGHLSPYRLLVDAVHDYAIFMLSPGGRVASWNAGAEKIHGYTPGEIVGKHFSIFYPPEAVATGAPERALAQARTGGRFEEEGWRVGKGGRRFWASVVLSTIHDKDGTLVGFSKITRDLSERRRQEEALRESEERFRLLVEGIRDYAIFMLDGEGHVRTWGPGAEAITGFAADEIVGRHVTCLYPADVQANGQPARDVETARSAGRFEAEGWRARKDGRTFCAHTIFTALPDREGSPRGFAGIIRDLTEHRRAERLEYEGRNMADFLAMFGHELRDPLAPIRTAIGVMQRGGDEKATRFSLEVLDRQSRHLTRLVDDLLDVSRLHGGGFRLQREPTRVATIVAQAVETVSPLVKRLNHTITTRIDDYDAVVNGDPQRLVQLLVNLLNNAANYTPAGGYIELTVTRRRGEAVIRVRDTGVGIPADLLPKVFDLFVHGDRREARTDGGLGVGLTLVRRIAELHGGAVEARSEGTGRGSEFTVRLPTIAAVARGDADRGAALDAGRPLRVMVVDDNRDGANSTAMLLRLWGHEALGAYDGPTALSLATEFRPEVFLLDLGLPQMSGYELARRLRDTPGLADAVLIAMTGYGQESDIAHTARAGFDGHLVKPVDEDELKGVLAAAGRGELHGPPPAASGVFPHVPGRPAG